MCVCVWSGLHGLLYLHAENMFTCMLTCLGMCVRDSKMGVLHLRVCVCEGEREREEGREEAELL